MNNVLLVYFKLSGDAQSRKNIWKEQTQVSVVVFLLVIQNIRLNFILVLFSNQHSTETSFSDSGF